MSAIAFRTIKNPAGKTVTQMDFVNGWTVSVAEELHDHFDCSSWPTNSTRAADMKHLSDRPVNGILAANWVHTVSNRKAV